MLRLTASAPRRVWSSGSLAVLVEALAPTTCRVAPSVPSVEGMLASTQLHNISTRAANNLPWGSRLWAAGRPSVHLSKSFATCAEPQLAGNEDGHADVAPIGVLPELVLGGAVQPTPSMQQDLVNNDYMLMHPVYTRGYLESVKPTHKPRETVRDKVGYAAIQALRWGFDRACGYGPNMSERQWLRRMLFLETVAGVPGMVAGMLRHMRSLRSMRRDHGWIHTLLEEAENERMHLLTFLKLREPGLLFRSMVLLGQGVFFNAYTLAYILWPRCCHAFIGYLEEEAVRTYTHAVEEIDSGKSSISHWAKTAAPDIAISYWRLEPGATLRDVVLNVRADEAAHSFVNHTFSALGKDAENPFSKGSLHVP